MIWRSWNWPLCIPLTLHSGYYTLQSQNTGLTTDTNWWGTWSHLARSSVIWFQRVRFEEVDASFLVRVQINLVQNLKHSKKQIRGREQISRLDSTQRIKGHTTTLETGQARIANIDEFMHPLTPACTKLHLYTQARTSWARLMVLSLSWTSSPSSLYTAWTFRKKLKGLCTPIITPTLTALTMHAPT